MVEVVNMFKFFTTIRNNGGAQVSYFLIWNCCTVNVIDMVSRGASVGTRGGHPAMKPLQRTEELKREMIFYCTPEYEFNSFPSLLQYVLDTSSGNYDLLS